MPTRVKVGADKYCYTGPTCKLHGAYWLRDADRQIKEARKQLQAAETFEEFQKAKAEVQKAEANYDVTSSGVHQLKNQVSVAPDDKTREDLQTRLANAEKAIQEQREKATTDFINSQTPAHRAEDVYITTDAEKLSLYSKDTDPNVRANLALNPNITPTILRSLASDNDERVQTNVVLNTQVTEALLKKIQEKSTSTYVKTLASAQAKKLAAATKKASETRARKQERAAYVSSYSYSGKGGGKR